MNKFYVLLILSFLSISLISANQYNITSGENISFNIGIPYSYYDIIGNATLDDFNISQENGMVTIISSKYITSQVFDIIFYGEKGEEIYSYRRGSSGCLYNGKMGGCPIPESPSLNEINNVNPLNPLNPNTTNSEVNKNNNLFDSLVFWITIPIMFLIIIVCVFLIIKKRFTLKKIENNTSERRFKERWK